MQKMRIGNLILFLVVIGVLLHDQAAFTADTAIASFNISGTVPTIFSVTARGIPGDIDLTPNVVVNNRRLGLIHFKYNANVASILISSSTASGAPSSGSGSSYAFNGGFKVSVGAGCVSVDPVYNTPFTLSSGGTDIKSATTTALTEGVEEDCDLNASWKGTSASLPLAGVYTLVISVTMTSQ